VICFRFAEIGGEVEVEASSKSKRKNPEPEEEVSAAAGGLPSSAPRLKLQKRVGESDLGKFF